MFLKIFICIHYILFDLLCFYFPCENHVQYWCFPFLFMFQCHLLIISFSLFMYTNNYFIFHFDFACTLSCIYSLHFIMFYLAQTITLVSPHFFPKSLKMIKVKMCMHIFQSIYTLQTRMLLCTKFISQGRWNCRARIFAKFIHSLHCQCQKWKLQSLFLFYGIQRIHMKISEGLVPVGHSKIIPFWHDMHARLWYNF